VSESNVELARRFVEWFNARDAEASQAHASDDVELVPLRAAIENTAYRGPAAFAAFAADNTDSWAELRFDAKEFRDAGERVVVIGQLFGRARLTGADVDARLAWLFEFRCGRLSRGRNYTDIAEALQAAGLSA